MELGHLNAYLSRQWDTKNYELVIAILTSPPTEMFANHK